MKFKNIGIFIAGFLVFANAAMAFPVTEQRSDGAYHLSIDLSGSLQNPAFSPDGSKIVFTRFRNGYNRGPSDLYILDLGTGDLRPLVSDGSSNVNLPGSSWSKSGLITFSSERGHHDEIYVIPATGQPRDEVLLTNRPTLQSYEPSFSTDGKWVVFESHGIDIEEGVITKYPVAGGAYTDLTPLGLAKQPNWSPKGDMILYQIEEAHGWAIWSMNSNGNNQRRLTPQTESATDAAFFPDGRSIIYSSENEDTALANLYHIPARGGSPTRVTRFSGYDGAPSVSPDGVWVAFESVNKDPDNSSGTQIWIIQLGN